MAGVYVKANANSSVYRLSLDAENWVSVPPNMNIDDIKEVDGVFWASPKSQHLNECYYSVDCLIWNTHSYGWAGGPATAQSTKRYSNDQYWYYVTQQMDDDKPILLARRTKTGTVTEGVFVKLPDVCDTDTIIATFSADSVIFSSSDDNCIAMVDLKNVPWLEIKDWYETA